MEKPESEIEKETILKSLKSMQQQLSSLTLLLEASPEDNDLDPVKQDKLIADLNNQIIEAQNMHLTSKIESKIDVTKQQISHATKELKKKFEIFKIVITGGPCAGKTTAITKVADQLREKGYTVFMIPEAASLIFGGGGDLNLGNYSDKNKIKFQYYLLMLQMYLEDLFVGIAATGSNEKIVIISDRGTMDGSAYLSKNLWNTLLHDFDLVVEKIRDHRYDLVIHLSTAADGAEKYYTLVNNQARSETVEFARDIDKNLQEAWIAHPNFVQINNSHFNNFQEKIDSVTKTVYKFLGLPTSVTFYKKFIVANPNNRLSKILEQQYGIKLHEFQIKDVIFFKEDNAQQLTYFRRRKQNNMTSYIMCEKSVKNNQIFEKRRQVGYREFQNVKNLYAPNKYINKKVRHSFMWNKINFILDTMNVDGIDVSILVIQGFKDKTEIQLPEIIEKNIVKEVSDQIVDLLSELLVQNGGKLIQEIKGKLAMFSE